MRFFAFLLAAYALCLCPAYSQPHGGDAPAATRRPAADFAKLPFFESPELSPDGTRVAAKVSFNGQLALGIFGVLTKIKPVIVPLGSNDLLSWHWVNDSWLAVRLGGVNRAEGMDFYVTRIAGVPAAGGKAVPIAFRQGGESAEILWQASDGTRSEERRVGKEC